MARGQRLHFVCNGCHIYNLDNLTEKELVRVLNRNEGKGFMIVGSDQMATRDLLRKLATKSHLVHVTHVADWNLRAQLWFAELK
jgi:homospermidine synthase